MTQSELNNLYKNIATDFKLATRKTELWSLDYCYDILHDIKKYLLFDLAHSISLVLVDNNGIPLKAKKYTLGVAVNQNGDRPGSIEWEDGEAQELTVIINHSDGYRSLSPERIRSFYEELRIKTWGPSNIDSNFYGMQSYPKKQYTSGNSGISRVDFN